MSDDYWDKKEKFKLLAEKSGTCWHELYTEEKAKREELEAKYNQLLQQIKEEGLERANNKKVDDGNEYLRSYALMWKRL